MSKQPILPAEPRIYILPNLFTAGNLICGFLAILTIFEGMSSAGDQSMAFAHYRTATYYIFASCIFDLLDGRVARMAGQEGPFGREFDSIADVVSFGLAPALLLSKAVLFNLPYAGVGWGIAILFLLCAALRLARFNCMASEPKKEGQSSDFVGLPVPMAAGAIVSTMYLVVYLHQNERVVSMPLQWTLASAMVGVAILMMSRVIYPSFKHINFKKKTTVAAIGVSSLVIIALVSFPWVMPAVLFCCYLLYGLLRPWIAKRWQRYIEAKSDDDESDDSNSIER